MLDLQPAASPGRASVVVDSVSYVTGPFTALLTLEATVRAGLTA